MSKLSDIGLVVRYCREHSLTAMDVRGWGGLKRIEAAMKAGVNGTLTRNGWSSVAHVLDADRERAS